jgi:hypothetical protein
MIGWFFLGGLKWADDDKEGMMRWSVQKARVFMISKPLFSTRRDKVVI